MGNRASIGVKLKISLDIPADIIDSIIQAMLTFKQDNKVGNPRVLSILGSDPRYYGAVWDYYKLTQYTDCYFLHLEAGSKGDVSVRLLLEDLQQYLMAGSRAIVIDDCSTDYLTATLFQISSDHNGDVIIDEKSIEHHFEVYCFGAEQSGQINFDALDLTASAVWKEFQKLWCFKSSTIQLDNVLNVLIHKSAMSWKNVDFLT